jgi:hypothetical protein
MKKLIIALMGACAIYGCKKKDSGTTVTPTTTNKTFTATKSGIVDVKVTENKTSDTNYFNFGIELTYKGDTGSSINDQIVLFEKTTAGTSYYMTVRDRNTNGIKSYPINKSIGSGTAFVFFLIRHSTSVEDTLVTINGQ